MRSKECPDRGRWLARVSADYGCWSAGPVLRAVAVALTMPQQSERGHRDTVELVLIDDLNCGQDRQL